MSEISKYVLGIDLGGTNIKAGLVDESGQIRRATSIKTEREQGSPMVIKKLIDLINSYLEKEINIKAVGLTLPGSVDAERGLCIFCPNLKWENLELSKEIEENTGLKVKLINDANAACLGDYYYGAGRGHSNIIYLTLGTGVGSAVILGDRLLLGKDRGAPEAGHMIINPAGYRCSCGSRGCLETLVSATAIKRRFEEKLEKNTPTTILNPNGVTTKEIFAAYENKDPLAKEIIQETKYYLAIGISNLINIFNSEKVILAGGLMKSEEIILENLEILAKQDTYPSLRNFTISASSLGDNAGVLGAASLWFRSIESI